MSVEELDSRAGPAAALRADSPATVDSTVTVLALDDDLTVGEPPPPTPIAERARAAWARIPAPRSVVPAVACTLVLGILLGTAGTHTWRDRQARIAREATAALYVIPDYQGGFQNAGSGRVVVVGLPLTVTNGGPLPVTLTGLRVDAPGFRADSLPRSLRLRPNRPTPVSATLRIDCTAFHTDELAELHATVRTADGRTRDMPLAYPSAAGYNVFEQGACEQQGDIPLQADYVGPVDRPEPGTFAFQMRVRGEGDANFTVTGVDLPWAPGSASVLPGTGEVRGGDGVVSVALPLPSCAQTSGGQPVDANIGLHTTSVDASVPGSSYVTLDLRFQADVIAAIGRACGF